MVVLLGALVSIACARQETPVVPPATVSPTSTSTPTLPPTAHVVQQMRTPEPTATAAPIASPTLDPTPRPTLESIPTPTSAPTPTPEPTSTRVPQPTATPTPEPTATPTATPSPTPTPTGARLPWGPQSRWRSSRLACKLHRTSSIASLEAAYPQKLERISWSRSSPPGGETRNEGAAEHAVPPSAKLVVFRRCGPSLTLLIRIGTFQLAQGVIGP